jgi:hypothetical protein
MEVYAADGRGLGTVERVEHGALFAAGHRVTLDAVERIEAGRIHLWGDRGAYTVEGSDDEAAVQWDRSEGLPHTDEQLYVNEREVERSLEERLPRDGHR